MGDEHCDSSTACFTPSSSFCFFARPAAVQPCAEHGDDLQHVLGEVFLERGVLALVEDDHFDVFRLTNGEDEFCAEAQQPILVRDDQTAQPVRR